MLERARHALLSIAATHRSLINQLELKVRSDPLEGDFDWFKRKATRLRRQGLVESCQCGSKSLFKEIEEFKRKATRGWPGCPLRRRRAGPTAENSEAMRHESGK